MKIIHCPRRFTRRSWGGTETCLLNLAKQQQAQGHEVMIFTSKALDERSFEIIEGVTVRRFDYCYPWFNLDAEARAQMDQSGGNLFSLPLAIALLREPGVSLIHAHTGKRLGGIVRTVARLRRIPYTVSIHGGVHDVPAAITHARSAICRRGIEWGKVPGALLGARRVFHDADAVFCLSNREQANASASYGSRVEYLPNGVDADRFAKGNGARFRMAHGIPADANVLLVMGRIDPQKNQRQLVRLLPKLKALMPNPYLLMIGHVTNDSYAAALASDIRALGLSDCVQIIPGLPYDSQDLVDAYHAADVFCLPSIHEPFGLVILEAWAAGLPVVAAAVGGIPDFVRHNEDTLLAAVDDDTHWSQAIATAIDPGRAEQLGNWGRARARREFDWSVIAERATGIYRELAA